MMKSSMQAAIARKQGGVARAVAAISLCTALGVAGRAQALDADALAALNLWGYGEVYYNVPIHDTARAQADLARAVFGIGYDFDPKTVFNSEYEVEHAVSSASDVGEFEVEQFFVDRELPGQWTARIGLQLMPFGLLNEHHEPTNFYGVQRNFVETLIIPSTWREGGLSFRGQSSFGLTWSFGATTGFDLSKWNFAPEFPQYLTALDLEDNDVAPLQQTHQELGLANASKLNGYVAVNYIGLPGLLVGGAYFTGDAVKVPAPTNAPIPGNMRVTLWELHARYNPGDLDLSGVYAHGAIGNVALANVANPGSPDPIPSQFYGWYLQAAYQLWQHGGMRLAPFARFEYYNMGSQYEGTDGPVVPAGVQPVSATPGDNGTWPVRYDHVATGGVNFYLNPHVVLKADYQHFQTNTNFTRVDLGLGLNF